MSNFHNAFAAGLQMLEAVLIANKLVDLRIKEGRPGVICKLDIEKAYDHVNWEFLICILKRMGCRDKWIGWMNWCISSTSFAMLVNGSPTHFCPASRGLRQGDTISPLLFILVMEVLSRMLSIAS